MDSGDLTVRQIAAVFAAMRAIRGHALDGLSAQEAAQALEWRVSDTCEAARIMGFTFHPLARKQHLCPVCSHLLQPDGHCDVCALRVRLERLVAVNEEEHRREVERLEREIDAVKQDTHRTRERMGTAPRKR